MRQTEMDSKSLSKDIAPKSHDLGAISSFTTNTFFTKGVVSVYRGASKQLLEQTQVYRNKMGFRPFPAGVRTPMHFCCVSSFGSHTLEILRNIL